MGISIHALREEGDINGLGGSNGVLDFYPRPPRGGRQDFPFVLAFNLSISIHALREEGDWLLRAKVCGKN